MAWYDTLNIGNPSGLSGDGLWMGIPNYFDSSSLSSNIGAGNLVSDAFFNAGNGTDSGFGLSTLFGQNGLLGSNLMDVIGTIGGIGSGIANYFNGQNMLGLAKDQFEFNKALANRNLANQAKIINNQYDSSAEVAAAMAGSGGTTSDETIQRYRDNAQKRHVDGSWVG